MSVQTCGTWEGPGEPGGNPCKHQATRCCEIFKKIYGVRERILRMVVQVRQNCPWQRVQGVPCLRPMTAGIESSKTPTTMRTGGSGYRNWMGGMVGVSDWVGVGVEIKVGVGVRVLFVCVRVCDWVRARLITHIVHLLTSRLMADSVTGGRHWRRRPEEGFTFAGDDSNNGGGWCVD